MNSPMEINSIIDIGLKFGLSFAGVVVLLTSVVIWMRTRSTHILMSRLWVLFNGKQTCEVPLIKKFLDTQAGVLQFRFMTGLHVRTEKQIDSLVSWTKKNDEDMGEIAACGGHFNLELPGLKDEKFLPKEWFLFVLAMITSSLALLVLLSVGGVILDRAILQIKQSETWFTLDKVRAKPVSDQLGFKLDTCSAGAEKIAPSSGFSVGDVEIICNAFSQSGTAEYVSSNLRVQRFLFGWSGLCIGYLCVLAFSSFGKGMAAKKMCRRLAVRAVLENSGTEQTG